MKKEETKKLSIKDTLTNKEAKIETKIEKKKTNLNYSQKFAICSECENLTPKSYVCIKLDCKQCKGDVRKYTVENNSFCPIDKW